MKVVEGLSWLMSLVGPTLIAVDQIDAIVSASNAKARARAAQTREEEAEAQEIVALLTQGLMDIHEKKRRAVTVLSCLEATWEILKGRGDSFCQRPLSKRAYSQTPQNAGNCRKR